MNGSIIMVTQIFLCNIFNTTIKRLAKLTYLFYKQVIDGITNEIGFTSFFTGKDIKYEGDGNISFYLI